MSCWHLFKAVFFFFRIIFFRKQCHELYSFIYWYRLILYIYHFIFNIYHAIHHFLFILFLVLFIAPLGSYIGNRLSSRIAIMFGGLLSTAGLLLSSLATSVEFLYLTLGVLTGLIQICTHTSAYKLLFLTAQIIIIWGSYCSHLALQLLYQFATN